MRPSSVTTQLPRLFGPLARSTAAISGLAVGHLLAMLAAHTLRGEHLIGDTILLLSAWHRGRGRVLATGLLPLWAAGALMDAQRFFIHLRAPVHTGDVWLAEQRLFSVNGAEWFSTHHFVALDFISGVAYASYLFVWIAAVLILFVLDSPRFRHLAWAFLWMSCLGIATYLLFPVAPPWYVMTHGLGPADVHATASAAGAGRFDALLGTTYFAQFYSRNPNVFGAMPSLHVGYPALLVFFTWERGWLWRALCLGFTVTIAFAAVYLAHHYVIDVVAGALAAVVVSIGVEAVHA